MSAAILFASAYVSTLLALTARSEIQWAMFGFCAFGTLLQATTMLAAWRRQ